MNVPAGAGPANSLADVVGLRVGHATRQGDGWLTGTTVIVTSGEGAVAGVDVRGGAPGSRETDLLDPRNAGQRVHAVVLGGGSAFGLAAADGVMSRLEAAGRGVRIGQQAVVPIVPAAIVFDLGRGGGLRNRPGPEFGQAAYDAALGDVGAGDAGARDLGTGIVGAGIAGAGNVGAGTGAVAGGLKGGVGSASVVLESGQTVAALAVVNALGSAVHPVSGTLYGASFGLPGEFDWLRPPVREELAAGAEFLGLPGRIPARPLNTTIGVVATDVPLTKAQCAKLAGVAHDGLARAIRPAHSMFDGDTIFGLSTGDDVDAADGGTVAPALFHEVLAASADCFTRAVVHGVLSATSVTTPAGRWRSYLDAFPSADGAGDSREHGGA